MRAAMTGIHVPAALGWAIGPRYLAFFAFAHLARMARRAASWRSSAVMFLARFRPPWAPVSRKNSASCLGSGPDNFGFRGFFEAAIGDASIEHH